MQTPLADSPPPNASRQLLLRTVRILLKCILVTTRKRSLGQGNIFIGMCQEFYSQGGGGSVSVHAGSRPPPRLETPQDWRALPRMENPSKIGEFPKKIWRTPCPKIGEPPFPLPKNGEPPTKIGEAPPRMENPLKNGDPPKFFWGLFFWTYGQRAGGTHPTGMHSCYHYFYKARFPPDKTPLLRETDFGCIIKAILPQRMNRVRIGTTTSPSSVIFSH